MKSVSDICRGWHLKVPFWFERHYLDLNEEGWFHCQLHIHLVVILHPKRGYCYFLKPEADCQIILLFFFFLKKATLLGKKNEVNPIFLLMWDWWTKMAWRAGRHQTDWTSSGFCYFTSKQCGRCDFHFNLSDYLIFLSAISPPSPSCTYILSVNVLVQSCDIDFRINSK